MSAVAIVKSQGWILEPEANIIVVLNLLHCIPMDWQKNKHLHVEYCQIPRILTLCYLICFQEFWQLFRYLIEKSRGNIPSLWQPQIRQWSHSLEYVSSMLSSWTKMTMTPDLKTPTMNVIESHWIEFQCPECERTPCLRFLGFCLSRVSDFWVFAYAGSRICDKFDASRDALCLFIAELLFCVRGVM